MLLITNIMANYLQMDAGWPMLRMNPAATKSTHAHFPNEFPSGRSQLREERLPAGRAAALNCSSVTAIKMMVVDIQTEPTFKAGTPRVLFEGQFGPGDITPDGQRFLMVQSVVPEQPPTKIHLILNWFEKLKEKVPLD